MGYLDDLKRQADALRAEQQQDAGLQRRQTMLTDAACKTALDYWLNLAQQLNVLRPTARARYALDTRCVLQELPAVDFRVDSRRRSMSGQDGFDHVVMQWSVKGGRRIEIAKDFVADIDRLEARLRQAGIQPLTTALRDPDNGKLLSMQYAFDDQIACSVRLQPDPDSANLQGQVHNLDGLETLRFTLPAVEFSAARLDELARWIVGEPHRFLDGLRDVSRSAPA